MAAKAFFRNAFKNNWHPGSITIDKPGRNITVLSDANKDLAEEKQIEVRQVIYLNNELTKIIGLLRSKLSQCLASKVFAVLKLL